MTTLVRRVLPLVLLLGCFVVLARMASQPLGNPDTYFHLRFGREFLDGAWSIRHPGSPTSLGTAEWVPTQWSAQVLMAWLEQRGGLAAVAWFSGVQLVLLATALYAAGRRFADPLVASVLTAAALIASLNGLSMRPQVVSYVLVALTAMLWLSTRPVHGRIPWALVPLTWLWATYHGMWPVGIVIGAAAVLGLALEGAPRRRLVTLAAVPLLSALAAAATPVGPGLYRAVLLVNSRGTYFSEWDPPDFTSPPGLVLLAVTGATVTILVRRAEPTRWTLVLLLGLGVALAVYSSRTVPLAAAVVTPIAAAALQGVIGDRTRSTRRERTAVVLGAALTLGALAMIVPSTAADTAPQPSWVDPTLSALPAGTRILGDISFGGIVMWAHPQLDVVMSGYGDIYTDAELDRNDAIGTGAPGWADDVAETGAQYALTSTEGSLSYSLRLIGWSTVRRSAEVELLRAPAPTTVGQTS